jgi:site-specific DNA-methyltransferase (adenine-specific)
MSNRRRAPRNRTIELTEKDRKRLASRLLRLTSPVSVEDILDTTICQDIFEAVPFLPEGYVDLLFIDPPYNLEKEFSGRRFKKTGLSEYADWIDSWLSKLTRILKPSASVYICSEWGSSAAVHMVAEKYFTVRNRITWEREKGRGALRNWKNCSEDIWFCTVSNDYTFNVEAVKLKRRVLAPYTHETGEPRDWERSDAGNFRLTYPSNLWADITVPFWSMPENTDHPTQKPEKLVAKIILASSNPGDVVFDPFLGSGTTSVVAKKLERHYVGVEVDETYACLAQKRLEMAESDASIQGYHDEVFWERNTVSGRKPGRVTSRALNIRRTSA